MVPRVPGTHCGLRLNMGLIILTPGSFSSLFPILLLVGGSDACVCLEGRRDTIEG